MTLHLTAMRVITFAMQPWENGTIPDVQRFGQNVLFKHILVYFNIISIYLVTAVDSPLNPPSTAKPLAG